MRFLYRGNELYAFVLGPVLREDTLRPVQLCTPSIRIEVPRTTVRLVGTNGQVLDPSINIFRLTGHNSKEIEA
jgi:hypothetical protein